jgi:hypothetical protein
MPSEMQARRTEESAKQILGHTITEDIRTGFQGAQYTLIQQAGYLQQHAADIYPQIKPATGFGCCTHGMVGRIGDSSITHTSTWLHPPNADNIWNYLTTTDIKRKTIWTLADDSLADSKVMASPPIPAYSFVILMMCVSSTGSGYGPAFGIPDPSSDRAILGWPAGVADEQHTADWTASLFTRLNAGDNISEACQYATDHFGGVIRVDTGGTMNPQIGGDANFKLHGVYTLPGLAFGWDG